MHDKSSIGFEEFLLQPTDKIRQFAPKSVIYSVSGTRRSAALAGISSEGENYTAWTYHKMLHCINILFDYGVQHIIKPIITPSQFKELTPDYSEHLWEWLQKGLGSQQAIADYRRLGWQVRIPFSEHLPQLQATTKKLINLTATETNRYLWLFIIPEHDSLWRWTLPVLGQKSISSIQEAIQTLYKADIPAATMLLDFGKPVIPSDLLPPFLAGKLECYWTQRPGYSLDEEQFRQILYDFAYVRKTWREDKTGRAEKAHIYRQAWEEGPILGLGTRLGPFWYPQPTTIPGVISDMESDSAVE